MANTARRCHYSALSGSLSLLCCLSFKPHTVKWYLTVETSAIAMYLHWLNSLALLRLCYWVSQPDTIISRKMQLDQLFVQVAGIMRGCTDPCCNHLSAALTHALVCTRAFDLKLHLTPDYSHWIPRVHVNILCLPQSLASSCCTLGRSRSEE